MTTNKQFSVRFFSRSKRKRKEGSNEICETNSNKTIKDNYVIAPKIVEIDPFVVETVVETKMKKGKRGRPRKKQLPAITI